MPEYDYLIVGGGMTADAAVRGIRELDENGTIGLLSKETFPPYDKPPLSKALWKGEPLERIWRDTEELGVETHLGRAAVRLDPLRKTVEDNAGESYRYGRLLLATGGVPRRLRGRDDGVIYFRDLADYLRLRDLTEEPRRVAVIGGGYIGAEIAAALAMNGHQVEMIFPERTLLARLLPTKLGEYVNGYYREKGVALHPATLVDGVEEQGAGYRVRISGGDDIEAEVVIAGLGIIPNTELAEAAGLEINGGISVNQFLQTGNDDIFAAGDAASIFDQVLQRQVRFEHEDNANTMGFHAGQAMAGKLAPYSHLPLFYSDLFELGWEGVGRVDSSLTAIADWEKENEVGIIYYLNGSRVEGTLLWNSWGKVDAARDLIASRQKIENGRVPRLEAAAAAID